MKKKKTIKILKLKTYKRAGKVWREKRRVRVQLKQKFKKKL